MKEQAEKQHEAECRALNIPQYFTQFQTPAAGPGDSFGLCILGLEWCLESLISIFLLLKTLSWETFKSI